MRFSFYRNEKYMGTWTTQSSGTAQYLIGMLRYLDPKGNWSMAEAEEKGGG